MTENESLTATLQNAIECATDDITKEDLEMMVKCLEELEQYRAIGTVEDWKRLIEKEATERRKLAEYFMLGSVEEFKALKEKSVAKKVVTKGQGHEADCYCPNCNTFLGSDQDFCFSQTKHCGKCGQAVDYD